MKRGTKAQLPWSATLAPTPSWRVGLLPWVFLLGLLEPL